MDDLSAFNGRYNLSIQNWQSSNGKIDHALTSSRLSFKEDCKNYSQLLLADAQGALDWSNLVLLGIAAGSAIVVRQDLDREFRDNTLRHSKRWGAASTVIGRLGDATFELPVMMGVYTYSLRKGNQRLHQTCCSLINAYTLTGIGTIAVKAAINSDRPSNDWTGGQFGFPSGHVSSSFTIAAVLEEYYGVRAAVPAYIFAGMVGWSRIDECDHDLSDVVFGAALGYVIGKSVCGRHLRGDPRVHIEPYIHPLDGTIGMMVSLPF